MASTPESKVKLKTRKILDEFGVYYFFPVTGGFGKSGVFDIAACYKGHFIGIEVKADCKKKPTALQSLNAKKANACGATTLLVHSGNLEVLVNLLTELRENESVGFNGASVWPVNCDTVS